MIIRSPFEAPIKSAIRSPFGVPGSESRNFTTLASAGSKHYTIPTKTLSGDFSVKCNFTKGASDTMAIGGSSGNSNHFIAWVTTATALQIKIDGTTNAFVTADLNDGKYHEMEIVRTSGDVEVFIDGASIGTGSNNVTGDFVLGLIGGNNSPTNLWDGVIANVNINNSERFYKIDETWDGPSTVLVDSGSDGSNGTAVNITSSDSENFNFDGSVSPNTWTNDAETIVIEVAGT